MSVDKVKDPTWKKVEKNQRCQDRYPDKKDRDTNRIFKNIKKLRTVVY